MKGELMIPESYLTGQVRKSEILIVFLVVISFAIGIYIYPQMPEQMASHWGIEGQVDGYMSKFWGIFLMPIISLVLALLFILLPKIDPLKNNIEQFRKYFDGFIIIIFLFFLYIYGLTIYWNLGHIFNMGGYMTPAMAILFYYCGILIKNSKRNWFIGIKTPWTLSSDVVWDKTHKVGAKLFKASAIICLLGLIWPLYAMWFVLVPILFSTIFVFIYSYLEFKKISLSSIFLLVIQIFIFCFFGINYVNATVTLDDVNGTYINDFASTAGILSSSQTEIVAGNLVLTKSGENYNSTGYIITNNIAVARVVEWGTVSITGIFPTTTEVKIQVMDNIGKLYSDTYLPNNSIGVSTFPVDLSNISPLSCASNDWTTPCSRAMAIRFKIILTTSDITTTPQIDSLTFNWILSQGDLSSSTFSTSDPWPSDAGDQKGTNHSAYGNSLIYPAFRWKSTGVDNVMSVQNVYALRDKIVGAYVSGGDYMFALNRDSGSELWKMPVEYGVGLKSSITQNGTYYTADWGMDNIYAIDTNTGQIKWSYNFYGGHGNGQAIIGNDGTIFTLRSVGSGPTSTLYAFNSDGTIKFTKNHTLDGVISTDLPQVGLMSVGVDGTLYYTYAVYSAGYADLTDKGKILAIDPDDGSVKWEYAIGDASYSDAPLIDSNGIIYIANSSSYLLSRELKLFALQDDGDHAILQWERSFGIGEFGHLDLTLKSNGNLFGVLGDEDSVSKPVELSVIDGSTIWEGDSISVNPIYVRTDNIGNTYVFYINSVDDDGYINIICYDVNQEIKWSVSYPFDAYNESYSNYRPAFDERGYIYGTYGMQDIGAVIALAPWSLSISSNLSDYYYVGNTINFNVVSSMLSVNPVFGGDNQVQVVIDNGDKIPLVYNSTNSNGDSVWTGSYTLPSISDGIHTYTIEAGQTYLQTDSVTHFNSVPASSNNTGLTLSGNFTVVSSGGGIACSKVLSSPTISINNKSINTFSKDIVLNLTNVPDIINMAISNDPDFKNIGIEPFNTIKNWSLSDGNGLKTVYAKFYNSCGESSQIVSSSINLQESDPSLSSTLISKNPQSILNFLAQQLADLQQQLANQQGGSTHYQFTHNLQYKDTGEDVRQLQTFLKYQGTDIYPEGLVTGYFGNLTKLAVQRFQLKYNITTPDNSGYGYVGPKTREKINSL